MRFDTIIIGGGLSGLACGIRLQRGGARCAILSTGQSALHFSSGSFDLLNRLPDGRAVEHPAQAVGELPEGHPYALLGTEFARYAREARELLVQCGVAVRGDLDKNRLHLTPMGTLKSSWLTLSDFRTFDSPEELRGKQVRIVNFSGFLDFNTAFVAEALESYGAECRLESLSLPEVDRLRVNPTEMRAVNIARVLDRPDLFDRFVAALGAYAAEADLVVVPAVFGLDSTRYAERLARELPSVALVPTMPPSVAGIRTQQQLRRTFEQLGGVFMAGDTVVRTQIVNNRVERIHTANRAAVPLQAANFVLASGSFFSRGLVADMARVREPLFELDVRHDAERAAWYDPRFFHRQNYLAYGVAVDERFRALKEGRALENLYAVGSVLSGFNPIHEGCGAGVALLTALRAADQMK